MRKREEGEKDKQKKKKFGIRNKLFELNIIALKVENCLVVI